MHMTSQVAGDLSEGKSPIDVLRATFPAGTVSGAPKVRAMEIIDELEPTKRGPYAGIVGYVDFSGNLDTAIAIRTMFWRNGRATLQAGAGIVGSSRDEDLECRNKALRLLPAAARSSSTNELSFAIVLTTSWSCVVGATSFLQASCRGTRSGRGRQAHALLLQPQGKLIVDFFALHREADEWWCVCEGGFGEALAAGLRRFQIRVKVEVEPRPVTALAVRGLAAPDETHGTVVLSVAWNGVPAFDAIGAAADIEAFGDALGLPVLAADAYERARIEAGVPRLGFDLDEAIRRKRPGSATRCRSRRAASSARRLVCASTRGHESPSAPAARTAAGTDVSVGDKVVGGSRQCRRHRAGNDPPRGSGAIVLWAATRPSLKHFPSG
jgi:hypothetical protein